MLKIDQIAIAVPDPIRAKGLLDQLGAGHWHEDTVSAAGTVRGVEGSNVANLSFNYDLTCNDGKPMEFEVLDYTEGPNWMDDTDMGSKCVMSLGSDCPVVSHLGMHVTHVQLEEVRTIMAHNDIPVVQEVTTTSHTNPAIAGNRRYNYVIFGTRSILGADLKFIVRLNQDGTVHGQDAMGLRTGEESEDPTANAVIDK